MDPIVMEIPAKDIIDADGKWPEEWVNAVFSGLAIMAMNAQTRPQSILIKVIHSA